MKSALQKGEGLTDKVGIGLSQGVIPAFHVIDLPALFANALVRFFWKTF